MPIEILFHLFLENSCSLDIFQNSIIPDHAGLIRLSTRNACRNAVWQAVALWDELSSMT